MTITLSAAPDGLSGSLQIGGVDAANFGAGISQGNKNKLINGGFNINQRVYVSGAAVGTNLYGLDRWKMAASADTFTFSTTANKTTVTIPAGKVLRQVIEGLNLQSGTYTLSWEGTAQGKIGAGSLSASGVTGSITGGTDTTIEFGPGTVANAQLEYGSKSTHFEYHPYGTELALCQRYYERGTAAVYYSAAAASSAGGSTVCFKVEKLAPPTITSLTTVVATNVSSVTATNISAYGFLFEVQATGAGNVRSVRTYEFVSEL